MSLLLSPLQQSWLQEIQVATPFLTPYVEKKPVVPRPTRPMPVIAVPERAPAKAPEQAVAVTPLVPVDKATLNTMDLEALQAYAEQCQGCDLHAQRSNVVWGAGQTQQPDWFVISAAPSTHEELAGLPMQGKSGELFAAQMQSIGIDRAQQLYLTQLIKCRPNQAVWEADHAAACQALLFRQIALIEPKALLLLGEEVVALFFGESATVSSLRGQRQSWKDKPVVVSHHPASLLLRPQLKAEAWEDLQLMRRLMA